jgi:PST family polysaccharide transporter
MAGCGYWSLVMMQLGNGLAVTVAAWGLSRWRPSRPRIDRDAIQLVRFGGAVTGYNLLGYLITNLDNILIGARFGAVSPSVGYIAPLGGRLGGADDGGVRLNVSAFF